MPVRLVVFDIAGTTLADERAVSTAFRNAFRVYGFTVNEEDIKPLMGYKKPVAIHNLLEAIGVTPEDDLINDIYREFEIEMLDHYEYSSDVKPMPGAEEVMLALKEKGLLVALNTGFSKAIADAIMKRLQWVERGLVDHYIASDEVIEGRPQPFMIQELMHRAGVDDPQQVIKIGDTEVDVNEGLNAGCALVIGITTGAFTREQLEPYLPDHIINHLSELPSLISAID
ncbi:MAG: HAD hydrolase-like protein [Chitinophagaceae bacterium]|nr:HAD hydrolase-like protein [Chitinophagaceae bacterium]